MPTGSLCFSPTPRCTSRMSSVSISVHWPQASSTRSSRHSKPTAMPASPRVVSMSTAALTPYARSTSSCSRPAAVSRWSTAPRSTTGALAHSSTTSCAGGRPICRRRPGWPSTYGAPAAGSPPLASTTTSILRPRQASDRGTPPGTPWPFSEALVEPVEGRALALLPRLAQPRRVEVPVRADLPGRLAQIVPELREGRASPEPVAVVDAVDHQTRLQHQRVRNHRVVLGVRVLLDLQILLHDPPGV